MLQSGNVFRSYMAVITIVVPFHKGGHGCDYTIVIVCVVQIQLVLHVVRSLIPNSIEEVPGDDMQLVGRSQGSLKLLPLLSLKRTPLGIHLKQKRGRY